MENLNPIGAVILFIMYLPAVISLKALPIAIEVRYDLTIQCYTFIGYIGGIIMIFTILAWIVAKIFHEDITKYY